MSEVEIGRDTQHRPIIITYDDELSLRDFTGWIIKDHKELSFNGKTVYSSCFSNETPDAAIFPADMEGVVFVKCNLDNVAIPEGNSAVQCSQRRFKVMNDLRDWELNEDDEPVKLVNEKSWKSNGYSIDPAEIPSEKIDSLELVPKVIPVDPVGA